MIGILYWNIHKNQACLAVLTALTTERKPDVIMLAECPFDEATILMALGTGYSACTGSHPYVRFYASTSVFSIENDSTEDIYNERLVMAQLGSGPNAILLVGVHLPSKLNGTSQNAQAHDAQEYRLLIEMQEKALDIHKTIIFGDFNMNAHDLEMLDRKRGFRTVPTRRLAAQSLIERKNSRIPRRCFYNPMWAWLGDYVARSNSLKPAGTFFWSPGNPEDLHWNSLDAVIVSPEAIAQFDLASLEIVTQTAAVPPAKPIHLFTPAGALSGKYSDHLPLYFNINL